MIHPQRVVEFLTLITSRTRRYRCEIETWKFDASCLRWPEDSDRLDLTSRYDHARRLRHATDGQRRYDNERTPAGTDKIPGADWVKIEHLRTNQRSHGRRHVHRSGTATHASCMCITSTHVSLYLLRLVVRKECYLNNLSKLTKTHDKCCWTDT